ncbi:hypothetical protein TVAG_224880 [Trichomonas vaginalis G3]|uniref:Uncharacterized protein n=1 Tax=Trichomonas vaginalis (strain ATCC PRA-98 / G3) TaxID=412133 RepID=A2FSJ7_TRIV3|nr:hypothetical protein TVAGG3_0970500 [Trichomonas vaginalis G3]EAX92126.1 hypothetical protein TVAG_224880 [Trichomonas vaginalis G3]KAI5488556.1 hypothetical protein TVAGG3_0970500 [Trichomonas vaginalis G3]|eukprot:XP_001305056.1 hypothetical protein [Trichomonas vaginalis G3]
MLPNVDCEESLVDILDWAKGVVILVLVKKAPAGAEDYRSLCCECLLELLDRLEVSSKDFSNLWCNWDCFRLKALPEEGAVEALGNVVKEWGFWITSSMEKPKKLNPYP